MHILSKHITCVNDTKLTEKAGNNAYVISSSAFSGLSQIDKLKLTELSIAVSFFTITDIIKISNFSILSTRFLSIEWINFLIYLLGRLSIVLQIYIDCLPQLSP